MKKQRHGASVYVAAEEDVYIPDCPCGWRGTPTRDGIAANKEALAHCDPETLEEIKDLIPFLDGTLPDTYPEEEWIPNKYAPGSTAEE